MPTDTLALLTWLTTAAGSGWAASWLLDVLRRELRPTAADWRRATRRQRAVWSLLFAPRYARITALVLAAGIALLAAWPLALMTGQTYVDLAWSAVLAPTVSQLVHGRRLPTTIPEVEM